AGAHTCRSGPQAPLDPALDALAELGQTPRVGGAARGAFAQIGDHARSLQASQELGDLALVDNAGALGHLAVAGARVAGDGRQHTARTVGEAHTVLLETSVQRARIA